MRNEAFRIFFYNPKRLEFNLLLLTTALAIALIWPGNWSLLTISILKRGEKMLKITHIAGNSRFPILILEGDLTGNGVIELKKECEQYLNKDRKVILNFFDIRMVDESGIRVLKELISKQIKFSSYSLYILSMIKLEEIE